MILLLLPTLPQKVVHSPMHQMAGYAVQYVQRIQPFVKYSKAAPHNC